MERFYDSIEIALNALKAKAPRSVTDEFIRGLTDWGTEKGIIDPSSPTGTVWTGECATDYGYPNHSQVAHYVHEYGKMLWNRLCAAEAAGPLDEAVISPEGKTVEEYLAAIEVLELPAESPADAPVEVGRQFDGVFLVARLGERYLYRWKGNLGILTEHAGQVSGPSGEGTDVAAATMRGVRWVAQRTPLPNGDIYKQFANKPFWAGSREFLKNFA